MLDALVAGHLIGKPQLRTAKSGTPFVTFKLRASSHSGESVFVSGISFSASIATALAELDDGDAVAMSGELAVRAYTDKNGQPRPDVDLRARTLTTEYHVTRKRKAARPPSDTDDQRLPSPSQNAETNQSASAPSAEDFDDDIPF